MTTSTTRDILSQEKRTGCVKDLGPFHVSVTRRFLILTLISSSAISFLVGHSCRQFLLPEQKSDGGKNDDSFLKSQPALHSPVPPEGQEIPDFVYTGHTFQDGFSRSSDSVFLARIHGTEKNILKPSDRAEEEEENPTLENYHPTGRQLLVDIENVDGTFLNSESQLADAMIELVGRTGMTMLSYHCHRLLPVGVSCIGILLKSHVSFHTWPISGVIVLDILSTNEGTELISQIEVIEELFAIPRLSGGRGANPGIPHLRWAYHHRGFQQGENRSDSVDLNLLLGWMEHSLKTPIISEDTDLQTVNIYDVIYNRIKTLDSYEKSLVEGGNTYEAQNPDLFRPDRVVYLDGVLQSRLYGEAAFHETLAHPALFAHNNPKRVAVVGGGEGATLREVLKHATVEEAINIEIDEDFVDIAREHLKEWTDCSTLVGSADSCFDDPRADVYFEDAIAWFVENFPSDYSTPYEEKFDVIILDVLDPSSTHSFSDHIYNNNHFVNSLSRALRNDGILVVQTGEVDENDPPPAFLSESSDALFIPNLKNAGFQVILEYEDMHGGFGGVWNFLVAFKDKATKSQWYANQAEFDLRLEKRSITTKQSDVPLFRYFDGATMASYQYASRITETEFCRSTNSQLLCDMYLDPNVPVTPMSTFSINKSKVSPSHSGIFLNQDIIEGSYLGLDESTELVLVRPSSASLLNKDFPNQSVAPLHNAIVQIGYSTDFYGKEAHVIGTRSSPFSMDLHCDEDPLAPSAIYEVLAAAGSTKRDVAAIEAELVYNPFVEHNHISFLTAPLSSRKVCRSFQAGDEFEIPCCFRGLSNSNTSKPTLEIPLKME